MPERINQRQKLLQLLRENCGEWVGLPKILDLRISQYSARVHELRKLGYRIENKTQHHNGQVWSWFRLIEPGQAQLFEPPQSEESRRDHFIEPQLLARRL